MKKIKPQSKLKRFFKGVGKTIGLACVFLVFAIASAVGIIFLTPNGKPDDDAFVIPAQLTKILNHFQLVKALDVDLNVDVETPNDSFNVVLDARLDLNGGFENLNADGNILINTDSETVGVDFTYENSQIFVDVLKGKFFWNTNSLFEGLGEISTLLDLEIPSLDGMDLSSLDANTVLRFLSDLEEEVGSDSITLNINVPIIGKIQILCDLDYSVKAVYLPKTEISDGTTIALSTNLKYPNSIVVETPPASQYIDATSLVDATAVALKTLKQDCVSFDANISCQDFSVYGNFSIDTTNLSASFEANIFDEPLKVAAIDKNLYLEYGNIFLQFALSDADTLNQFLLDQFGIDANLPSIAKFLSDLQDGDVLNAVKNQLDDGEKQDINSVDLGKLEKLEKNGDVLTLSVRDFGSISISTSDDVLNFVNVQSNGLDISVNLTEPKPVTISNVSHANAALAIPAIDAVLNLIKNERILGSAALNVGGQRYDLDFAIDNANNWAHFCGNLFGDQFDFDYQNQTAFVSFKGFKVFAYENQFDQLASLFAENQSQNQIAGLLQSLFDKNDGSFIGLKQGESGLEITLQNNITIIVNYLSDLEIRLSAGSIDADITLRPAQALPPMPLLSTEGYANVLKVAQKFKSIADLLNGGSVFGDLMLRYNDLTISGPVALSQNAQAKLTLSCGGKVALLQIDDNTIFFDFDDLHLALPFEDFDEIVSLIENEFGIDLNSILGGAENHFDINNLLAGVSITLSENNFGVEFDGFVAKANFAGDKLSNFEIAYRDLVGTFTPSEAPIQIDHPDKEKYSSALDVVKLAASTLNYFATDANLNFSMLAQGLQLDGYVRLQNGKPSLSARGNIAGTDFEMKVLNGVLYFNTISLNSRLNEQQNAKVKFSLDDIGSVLQFLKDEFGFDLTGTLNSLKDLTSPSQKSFSFASLMNSTLAFSQQNGQSTLNAAFDDFAATVIFENSNLKNVTVKLNDLSIEANVTSKQTISSVKGTYFDIVKVIPIVRSVKNYIEAKRFDVTADFDISRNATKIFSAKNMALQIDATKNLQLYTNFKITRPDKNEKSDMNVNAAIYQNKLYVDYNNLKLSLDNGSLAQLLAMACDVLGLDPTILNDLFDCTINTSDVDMSTIAHLLLDADFESPFALLNLIDEIAVDKFDNNTLIIKFNAQLNNIEIKIVTSGTKLSRIEIKNLYSANSSQSLNVNVRFNQFGGVTRPDLNKDYLDLSGADSLLKAVANTLNYNVFDISGTFKINLKIGIIPINADIPVHIQVVMQDYCIKNLMAEIGPIPVLDLLLYNVNNDTKWIMPMTDRMFKFYYQDDYMYFYRTETKGKETLQKATMVPVDTVLADPLYYLQWGTGLNDQIMDEIRKTIIHDTDLGNVVKTFSAPANDDGLFTTTLNMQEITGEKKLGNLVVGLGITNQSGKKLLNKITADLGLTLISGTTLNLGSDNLAIKLSDSANTSALDSFVLAYKAKRGAAFVEYEAYNNNWVRASERTFTVKFDANVGLFNSYSFDSVTGRCGQSFNAPSLLYKSAGNKLFGSDYTLYEFAGWFTSPDYAPGTQVTSFVIPDHNVTLYAKWDVCVGYRTIYYYSELSDTQPRLLGSQYAMIGTALRTDFAALGLSETRDKYYTGYVDGVYGNYILKQRLDGWTDQNGNVLHSVPLTSQNVYANYATYQIIKR